MPAPQRHYYLLAGESLHALNRLIAYDRMINDRRTAEMMQKMRAALAEAGMKPDLLKESPAVAAEISGEFNDAILRAYKQTLGFLTPPVQVQDYADGTLYRAYHVLPRIAMNPGTSKMYFGLADTVNDPNSQPPRERRAIFIAEEDYKGAHYAPPGAKKLTEEEFAAYDAEADSFEYYRTYDEGTEMPADFDPARHLTVARMQGEHYAMSRATHAFILDEATQKEMAAYEAGHQAWIMAYQDYRDKLREMVARHGFGAGAQHMAHVSLADTFETGGARALCLMMKASVLESYRDKLQENFVIEEERSAQLNGVIAVVRPRAGTDVHAEIAALLESGPVEPVKTVNIGFTPRPTLSNYALFNDKIMGFPFMQIERAQDPDTRILAFRLPENVKDIAAPNADCQPLDAEAYAALMGAEPGYDAAKAPRHAFLLRGETLKAVQAFEADYADYKRKDGLFRDMMQKILHLAGPDCALGHYEMDTYRAYEKRQFRIRFPNQHYAALKPLLAREFEEVYSYEQGADRELREITLRLRDDSRLQSAMAQIPYEPNFPQALYAGLGFGVNKGYDLLSVESLTGMKQKAVLFTLPPYVTKVEPLPGTVAMTRAELMQVVADSHDISGGSVPPPRPAHMAHLPTPEGYGTDAHAKALKKSKDNDGLPLHPRSDGSWFKIRR